MKLPLILSALILSSSLCADDAVYSLEVEGLNPHNGLEGARKVVAPSQAVVSFEGQGAQEFAQRLPGNPSMGNAEQSRYFRELVLLSPSYLLDFRCETGRFDSTYTQVEPLQSESFCRMWFASRGDYQFEAVDGGSIEELPLPHLLDYANILKESFVSEQAKHPAPDLRSLGLHKVARFFKSEEDNYARPKKIYAPRGLKISFYGGQTTSFRNLLPAQKNPRLEISSNKKKLLLGCEDENSKATFNKGQPYCFVELR
jgi:hypothetical protein